MGFHLITMASTRAENSSTNDNVKTALTFLRLLSFRERERGYPDIVASITSIRLKMVNLKKDLFRSFLPFFFFIGKTIDGQKLSLSIASGIHVKFGCLVMPAEIFTRGKLNGGARVNERYFFFPFHGALAISNPKMIFN